MEPKQPLTLHAYQQRDIDTLLTKLSGTARRVVYQLPTGGGKTIVFSEIARQFIARFGRGVMVLTHRTELCRQTSKTLKRLGVANEIVDSRTKNDPAGCDCRVAMVETLRNRVKSGKVKLAGIGLVIIDEAHHNSFRKLLKHFKGAAVIGVTATPFSADVTRPMNRYYDAIVVGEPIQSLIDQKFLAKPKPMAFPVELNSLKTGIHGDYTVSSSNELYGSPAMIELLLRAYHEQIKGKKTLIFNAGIDASVKVCAAFEAAGVAVKHLDNKATDAERKEILKWFRRTKGAVLTSVSILTTGFDEPSIRAVVLNRATTSITLYHQMCGRGSRRLSDKKTFQIIDLGNNIDRFGPWEAPVDWTFVFEHPAAFAQQLHYAGTSGASHAIAASVRALFPHTLEMAFDVESHYHEAIEHDRKAKTVISQSVRQHAIMCLENADSVSHALQLADALGPEIDWRVREYVRCIGNASKSYKLWLSENYRTTLQTMIRKLHARTFRQAS